MITTRISLICIGRLLGTRLALVRVVRVLPKGQYDCGEDMSTNKDVFLLSLRYLLHEVVLVRKSSGAQADQAELILTSLKAQADRIDSLERELKKLIEAYEHGAARPLDRGGHNPRALAVAHNLTILPRPDDSIEVVIDGGKPFILPKRLAEMFLTIVSGDKDPAGADSAWHARYCRRR